MKSATKAQRPRQKSALLREYFLNALTLAVLKEKSAMQNECEVPEEKDPALEQPVLQNV